MIKEIHTNFVALHFKGSKAVILNFVVKEPNLTRKERKRIED